MKDYRFPFVRTRMRYLLLVITAFCLGVASLLKWQETGVILFLGYGAFVGAMGYTTVRLDNNGFSVRHFPWLCGIRNWQASTGEITSLFVRHMLVVEHRGQAENQFFVAVELRDGNWVHLLGPWLSAAEAYAARDEVALLWPAVQVEDARSGMQRTQRRAMARALLFWTGGFILLLLFTAAMSVWPAAS